MKVLTIGGNVRASCRMIGDGPPPMKGLINQIKKRKTLRCVMNKIGFYVKIYFKYFVQNKHFWIFK